MKLKICLTGLLCLFFKVSTQAEIYHNALKVGDRIPDITIKSIINAPYNSVKISDYKGKILVLDFWATWCVSCLNNFPKTYALQQQFPDQLKVLLVNCKSTRDKTDKVKAFFESRKAYYSFPSVVDDTVLTHLFPHQTIPHYVWIRNSKVVAITDAFEMTASNVKAMLSGDNAKIHQKVALNYDFNRPLFEGQNGGASPGYIYKSFLTRYKDGLEHSSGLATDESGKVSRIYALNYSKLSLIKMAYPAIAGICADRIILKANESGLSLADSNSISWKTKNCYAYESIFPPCTKAEAITSMRADIEGYFHLKVDEKALDTPCFVIKIADSTKIIKASTESHPESNIREGTGAPVYFINNSVPEILTGLEDALKVPFVDETGYDGRIDIRLPANLKDGALLVDSLSEQGFSIVREKRTIMYVQISKDSPGALAPQQINNVSPKNLMK